MITAVKGTQDLVFPEIAAWQAVEEAARRVFSRYGYTEIRTPVLEPTELFIRGIGDETDIVTKEMFTFPDRKGRSLTLRPENTAGVARAMVEHRLHESPLHARLYYIGPQFRYERPQKGRYRQFHQIGVEVLGDPAPGADAEAIAMVVEFLEVVGVLGVRVQVNSVGCPVCRPVFVEALRSRLSESAAGLCGDCRRRLETNPLRVLDCKVPSCQPILDGAPRFRDLLCEACSAHHAGLREALGRLGVGFAERDRLVRGLDYYTRTVFEVSSSALGAQDALLGGGRYDGLLEQLGGPALPGFGWALGMERLLLALPKPAARREPWTYVAWSGPGTYGAALDLARHLRAAGAVAVMEHSARSFKSALKRADRMNVRWVVLVGEEERQSGVYTLKDLETGEQQALAAEALAERILKERP
ncbi:MAG: histidine--tRNA ligase [Acidobacteriota bacterium]